MSNAERGRCNAAVKTLRALGVDDCVWEIRARGAEYRMRYPHAAFTWTALANRWGELASRQPEVDTNQIAAARFLQSRAHLEIMEGS